jgi:hypothetical protein
MFIIIPTNAHRSSVKLISKLLRHVLVLIHHLQGVYSCVSWIYELLKWYNTDVIKLIKIMRYDTD